MGLAHRIYWLVVSAARETGGFIKNEMIGMARGTIVADFHTLSGELLTCFSMCRNGTKGMSAIPGIEAKKLIPKK